MGLVSCTQKPRPESSPPECNMSPVPDPGRFDQQPHSSVGRSAGSGLLTEPVWDFGPPLRDGLALPTGTPCGTSGEAVSFPYPVKTSFSPEGGYILPQPCPLPWLLPPPLHCLFSLEGESEVREPFQGRHHVSAVAVHTHIKGVLLTPSPR